MQTEGFVHSYRYSLGKPVVLEAKKTKIENVFQDQETGEIIMFNKISSRRKFK